VSDRRVPYPPSALSPVSPEVARAAATPFVGRAWLASAVFLLPALLVTAILGAAIEEIIAEGRRRVLSSAVFLIQLVAAAGTISVHVRRARERVENGEPGLRTLGRWWRKTVISAGGLCSGFIVVWVSLGAALEWLWESPSPGLLRVVPLAISALLIFSGAALGIVITWIPAIRAIEDCSSGSAAAILQGIWSKSRGRLLLHAAVGGMATWLAWLAMTRLVGALYSWAGPGSKSGSASAILYDETLRPWLVWTPTLAVLGSAGVASYLLLRQLNQGSH
jgi:hypothetical protein